MCIKLLLCPWIYRIEKSFFNFCYFSVEDRNVSGRNGRGKEGEILGYTRFFALVLGLELLPLTITSLLCILLAVLPLRSGAQEEEEPLDTVK